MDRKKELKEIYKNIKPEMGVFIFKLEDKKIAFIEANSNLKIINSYKFRLNARNHSNVALQDLWKEHRDDFVVEVLEILKYDKDESKTDYSDELNILENIYKDKYKNLGYTIL